MRGKLRRDTMRGIISDVAEDPERQVPLLGPGGEKRAIPRPHQAGGSVMKPTGSCT